MFKYRLYGVTIIVSFALGLILPQTAQAHVLITDTTHKVGAILHATPDDDPIAGQTSQLIFDIQDETLLTGSYTAALSISDGQGQRSDVPLTLSGSTVEATFTFPVRGVYLMTLSTTDATGTTHSYNYSQRVSRGAVENPLDAHSYAWAEMAGVVSVVVFLLLVVVVINNRRGIARYSK